MKIKKILLALLTLSFTSCVTVDGLKINTRMESLRDYKADKKIMLPQRKIMVAEFINKTRYGKGKFLLFGLDMISTEFSKTGRYNVLERDPKKLAAIKKEIAFINQNTGKQSKIDRDLNLIEADFAVYGTLTSFGVQEIAVNNLIKTGVIQVARATVDIKVLNLRTGETWSETGEATSKEDSTTYLGGVVSRGNSYNQNSEERAVRLAIVDAMNKAIVRIDRTPWVGDGKVVNNRLYISGVNRDSTLPKGTKFLVYSKGKPVVLDGEIIGYDERYLGEAVVDVGNTITYKGEPANNQTVIVRLK